MFEHYQDDMHPSKGFQCLRDGVVVAETLDRREKWGLSNLLFGVQLPKLRAPAQHCQAEPTQCPRSCAEAYKKRG